MKRGNNLNVCKMGHFVCLIEDWLKVGMFLLWRGRFECLCRCEAVVLILEVAVFSQAVTSIVCIGDQK